MVFGGGCALAQSASKACTRPPTQRFQIPSEVIPVAPKRRRSYSATRSGEHTMIFKLKHANAAAYIHLVWTIVARATLSVTAALALTSSIVVAQQQESVESRLKGFDSYMGQVMKDWNAPGIGIGIVMGDKLVFAKGYGFRDYGKKVPYTITTTQPIASNTKLFTAVAVGLLVEEGKLRWDEPVKQFVPAIRFYNDELDRSATIRDMLSHRTGVTRHDFIWYKSAFT